jgi:ABC-type uncharacterized transport system auxiliary subunit
MKVIVVVSLAVTLVACGDKQAETQKPMKLFESQRNALDQAKQVQQEIDRAAEENRKKMEDAQK